MTRKKVTLAYITNDSSRKATFKKRKKGLLKKVSELSTLCGIEACAIIYSAYDSEPEVWPSTAGARRAIARFRNMPKMDQSKRMVNQMAFLHQRLVKVEEQLKKQQRDNREKEVTQMMHRALAEPNLSLQGLSLLDLNDLGWVIEKTVKEIDEKVTSLKKNPPPPNKNKTIAGASNNNNNNNNNGKDIVKGKDRIEEAGTSTVVNGGDLAMGSLQNQAWYMELMKPSEGLMGFGRFSNNVNYNNSNVDMNMMALALPAVLPPPYPCPSGHNVAASWSNYFFH